MQMALSYTSRSDRNRRFDSCASHCLQHTGNLIVRSMMIRCVLFFQFLNREKQLIKFQLSARNVPRVAVPGDSGASADCFLLPAGVPHRIFTKEGARALIIASGMASGAAAGVDADSIQWRCLKCKRMTRREMFFEGRSHIGPCVAIDDPSSVHPMHRPRRAHTMGEITPQLAPARQKPQATDSHVPNEKRTLHKYASESAVPSLVRQSSGTSSESTESTQDPEFRHGFSAGAAAAGLTHTRSSLDSCGCLSKFQYHLAMAQPYSKLGAFWHQITCTGCAAEEAAAGSRPDSAATLGREGPSTGSSHTLPGSVSSTSSIGNSPVLSRSPTPRVDSAGYRRPASIGSSNALLAWPSKQSPSGSLPVAPKMHGDSPSTSSTPVRATSAFARLAASIKSASSTHELPTGFDTPSYGDVESSLVEPVEARQKHVKELHLDPTHHYCPATHPPPYSLSAAIQAQRMLDGWPLRNAILHGPGCDLVIEVLSFSSAGFQSMTSYRVSAAPTVLFVHSGRWSLSTLSPQMDENQHERIEDFDGMSLVLIAPQTPYALVDHAGAYQLTCQAIIVTQNLRIAVGSSPALDELIWQCSRCHSTQYRLKFTAKHIGQLTLRAPSGNARVAIHVADLYAVGCCAYDMLRSVRRSAHYRSVVRA